MAYLPGSEQASLVARGWLDDGGGWFTSPGGERLHVDMSPAQTAQINRLAGQALERVQQGYGADDPRLTPDLAMLSAEHQIDPTAFAQNFTMPANTEVDSAGHIAPKPPSWWSRYGPWMLLAGATGGIAAPAIAGAIGGAGAAAGGGSGLLGSTPLATGAVGTLPTATGLGAGGTLGGLLASTPVSVASGVLPSSSLAIGAMGGLPTAIDPAVGGGVGASAGGSGWLGSLGHLLGQPAVASGLLRTGGQLAGGLIQAHAATSAAKTQAQAALQAAQLQARANQRALDFQKQQAALTAAQQAAAQQANYGQYAARQGFLSSLGQMMGLPARSIPAYVPLPTTVPSTRS